MVARDIPERQKTRVWRRVNTEPMAMTPFTAELIGTALLVLLGDGVVANVVLNKSKGHNSGWIVVATGWGLAVAVAVYAIGWVSTGHINPAVTLAMASIGKFPWKDVPTYLAAQMLGGVLGGVLVWLAYLPHWRVTEDPAAKLAVFCTAPAIRRPALNLVTEVIGTFVLVLGVLAILSPKNLNPNSGFPPGSAPCWWDCWSSRSGCPLAARPAMRSTQPATLAPDWPISFCPSQARASRTGSMPGCRSWARFSAASLGPGSIESFGACNSP